MRTCTVCEGLLPESLFFGPDTICKVCHTRLKVAEGVEYSTPGEHGIQYGYVNLFLAIRKQAILDDQENDWKSYWLEDPYLEYIWELLRQGRGSMHSPGVRQYCI